MTAKTIMIQGTASSVGKSILATALCRIFKQDGYKVAPFKAQNMALNSYVAKEGGEIGRAQAVQAEAAGIEPSIHMNPILLKPQADATSQVIVSGKPVSTLDAAHYYNLSSTFLKVVAGSLEKLRAEYEVIVIEGAGSPAEINLKSREIVNMRIARLVNSPVLLVGDIDRGGVFASLVGTMQLLNKKERDLIRGFIINKFRGNIDLLEPGLEFLADRYAKPVLGVIPYIKQVNIAQEDSVYLDERITPCRNGNLNIAVIRLPHISNYDDFDLLETHCNLKYVSHASELGNPDIIILPGTKTTISDLIYLHKSKLADAILMKVKAGIPLIGICGGYQMLGKRILDPQGIESDVEELEGLQLFDMETTFTEDKTTRQIQARIMTDTGLFSGMKDMVIKGYEIHNGKPLNPECSPVFNITSLPDGNSSHNEGTISKNGLVFGTYIHGIFHNADFTNSFLKNLGMLRGIIYSGAVHINKDSDYDILADIFRSNLDMKSIYNITFGGADAG
ncbi:MAG: cobyric acid synthase [Dehalococcoidia bacterium]|nr:cobyric acid synthase [Dehalococcoidia bacterium]MDD5493122.1 cobyric acid synthase [Dehalococcoidia bacterium]